MRNITAGMSQWRAQNVSGAAPSIANCIGGYFSVLDDYGLRVEGVTAQDGVPSPDSPVPIRCVKAGTKIRCCGKNLFDPSQVSFWYKQGCAYGNVDFATNSFTMTAQSDATNAQISAWNDYDSNRAWGHLRGKKVTMSVVNAEWSNSSANPILYFALRDVEGKSLGDPGIKIYAGEKTITLDVPENMHRILLIARLSQNNAVIQAGDTFTIDGLQIEYGDTATPFAPYTECEITTPCDLYEGDVWFPMTGVVKRNNGVNIFDGSNDEGWVKSSIGGAAWIILNPPMKRNNNENVAYAACDKMHYDRSGYYNNIAGSYYCDSSLCAQFGGNYTTISAIRQHLSNNPLTFVYPLKAPIVEHYAPQSIFAPQGTVNVLQSPQDMPAKLSATMMTRR